MSQANAQGAATNKLVFLRPNRSIKGPLNNVPTRVAPTVLTEKKKISQLSVYASSSKKSHL